MGSLLSSEINSDIEKAWRILDKQSEGYIPRNQLPALAESVIKSTQIAIGSDFALSFCSPYLTGQKISKQQVLDFIELQKSQQIENLELEAIKRQIEFYFSDENLSHDKFFNDLITSDTNGYVDLDVILKCQRIKNLKVPKERIIQAIRLSLEVDLRDDQNAVRRKNNKPAPQLKSKKSKTVQLPEQTVVILSVVLPEESKTTWKDLRDSFRAKYIDTEIVYVRFHGTEGHVGVTADTDIQKIISGGLEIHSIKAAIKEIKGDELLEFWKANGSHFDICSQTNKRKKFEKTKGINMGGKMFGSVSQLKNYVNSLLNGSAEGVIDPHYHNLISAVFRLHPEYEKKSVGLKTFAIGRHPEHPDSKCFFVVKTDGTQDDFSIAKCLQQL